MSRRRGARSPRAAIPASAARSRSGYAQGVSALPGRHQTVTLHFCDNCQNRQMQAQAEPQDRILDAAVRVFRRHGFRRSSIEQAAEEAGLTRQALYHHFSSKEALFRAVLERLYEQALAAGAAAAQTAEDEGSDL